MSQLSKANPRLLCSLVHKFGKRGVDDFDQFIKEMEAQSSQTVGEVFVFVDECHRTQSGKLHRTMKAMMPNAVFIGFTGTPLLKKDKQTTIEVFGSYIHTYKFSEAVEDQVILDLVYEARDIDQRLGSKKKIDAWFEAKTRVLNNWQKDELKKTPSPEATKKAAEVPAEYGDSGDSVLNLALRIDESVKRVRPDDWRGVEPRERVIKQALFALLMNEGEVERIFLIVKAQKEY